MSDLSPEYPSSQWQMGCKIIIIIMIIIINIIILIPHLHGLVVQVAGLGVAVSTSSAARAETLPARHLGLAPLRGAVVANLQRHHHHHHHHHRQDLHCASPGTPRRTPPWCGPCS